MQIFFISEWYYSIMYFNLLRRNSSLDKRFRQVETFQFSPPTPTLILYIIDIIRFLASSSLETFLSNVVYCFGYFPVFHNCSYSLGFPRQSPFDRKNLQIDLFVCFCENTTMKNNSEYTACFKRFVFIVYQYFECF